jgi:uncharacterized membrane protein
MTASPLPVVVHIVSAVPYAVLGAFQFSTRLRLRPPLWHKMTGRLVVVLGLVVALSALWMTRFSARQPGTGVLAFLFRLAFGSGMAACIVLGLARIRRGDVPALQAWMTRAHARPRRRHPGDRPGHLRQQRARPRPRPRAAWALNLVVAEAVIRRHRGHRPAPPALLVGSA